MSEEKKHLENLANQEYKYGFVTDIEVDEIPKGLNEDIIRIISEKKNEPDFMLEWRLKAFRHWQKIEEPKWPNVTYPPVDYQNIVYYSAPKQQKKLDSLDDVDPELRMSGPDWQELLLMRYLIVSLSRRRLKKNWAIWESFSVHSLKHCKITRNL